MKTLTMLASLALVFAMAAPAAAQFNGPTGEQLVGDGITVDPTCFDFSMACGCVEDDSLCVILPPGTVISAVDILFIMDVTGSMTEELNQVQTAAIQIMTDIENQGIDAAYGVGSFSDYPGSYDYCGYADTYAEPTDYPWQMNQDVTTNTTDVSNAINALTLKGGWDLPEDYSRALWESQWFDFRAGTKKIVLMFGDAPTHDCGFLGTSLGGDPGPNALMGDGDDLDYETVVAQLAAAGIIVISIDSSGETAGGPAWENFEYMAAQTGGTHYELAQASDIPQAIVDLITEQAEEITWLTLDAVPDDPFDAWFSFAPNGFANVAGPDTLCFAVSFHPVNTLGGDFNFNIIVDGDGAELALVPVHIYITSASAVEQVTWGQLRKMFYND